MSKALSLAQETLVRVSAALANRREEKLEEALKGAARGVPSEQVEEALLQSYLFLGYPITLNAFAVWRRISGRPAPAPAPGPEECAAWMARGAEVCEQVYGGQYEGLRVNVSALHPDMEQWMVMEGYGKVLGRPGLDLLTRELCVAALLAVLDARRQLYSHLRGALNVGATPSQIEHTLAIAAEFQNRDQTAQSSDVWRTVLERHRLRGASAS